MENDMDNTVDNTQDDNKMLLSNLLLKTMVGVQVLMK
jgi:hypothetical protein